MGLLKPIPPASHAGKTMYLKTMTDCNQCEIEIGNLKYYLKGTMSKLSAKLSVHIIIEKRLIHSPVTPILKKSPIPLLVVSPNHGKVEYKWECKSHYTEKWTKVEVPPYTCLLHVDTPCKYRCTVNEESITFDVKGKHCLICIWLQTVFYYSNM